MSEVHYIHCSLVPPVEHKHYQDMPHLVAGTQIVQLTWEAAFWDFRDVKEERSSSYQIHHNHTREEQLDDSGAEASIEPDPVDSWDDSVASHKAEDGGPQVLPLLREVVRVDLSREYGQYQR